jgi:hypothetical protein
MEELMKSLGKALDYDLFFLNFYISDNLLKRLL